VKIDPQLNLPGAQSPSSVSGADAAANARPLRISSESSAPAADQASLSSDAVQLSGLRAKLNSVPDIRQDRVAAISLALQNGTYSVSNKQIAQSLLRDLQPGSFAGG